MTREELSELHFIAAVEGILSFSRAAHLTHKSVAMQEMQDRRAKIVVPGTGRKLHQYANLYICGRNPMLYLRKDQEICLRAVSTEVLDLAGVIVTDQNAGGDYVSFRPAPDGLRYVDKDRTFSEYWTDQNPIEYWRKKAAKCAEVLVPGRVDPRYITHAYVASDQMKTRVDALNTGLDVRIDKHLFFR